MTKHWRVEFIGGPYDGLIHESLVAERPDRIGQKRDGFIWWYELRGDKAYFIKKEAECT